MKVWAFVLSVALSMTSAPASAEWSFLAEAGGGDKFFIDFDTLRKGKTARGWVLNNYPKADRFGDMSTKILYEANCPEEKIRELAIATYAQPSGKGPATDTSNQSGEWLYVPPGSIYDMVLKALCGKKQ